MTHTSKELPKLGVGDLNLPSFILCLLVGLIIWFSPHPVELQDSAWQLFAVFVATILGIILRPLPVGAVALIGMTVLLVTETLSVKESFAGFGNHVAWLVVLAFFIARGFIKTGLGKRLAYFFVRILGKHTLGLGYGLVATDLCLAPFIPSVSARAAGILFPILRGLAEAFGSKPRDPSSRYVASYLTVTSFQGSVVTSAMFLTAMAGNPVIADLAGNFGVEISWGSWALAAIVPGLCSLIAVPWLIYKINPPEIKHTPHAVEMAKQELAAMGPIGRMEGIMLGTLVFLLSFWAGGRFFGVAPVTTALIGLCFLLITGVLQWKDLLEEEGAWATFVWFSILMMMAGHLKELGFTTWFGNQVVVLVQDFSWSTALLALVLVYYFAHYFFASITAHVYSLFPPFLAVILGTEAPALMAALVLAFASNLCGGLTHYGTSPAPLLFGAGFVSVKDWWRCGLIAGIVNIIIWVGIGSVWWKLIGLW